MTGLRVQEYQCSALAPQLLLAASKKDRTPSATRRATARRLSSAIALVSPRGWLQQEGLANSGEGGLGHELAPPGAVFRCG